MKRLQGLLAALRNKGFRLTKARIAVLESLLRHQKPIAALELHAVLSKTNMRVDKVTVYRELKFLSEQGIVHPVHLKDNIRRYELAPESGHKHHFVCTTCKTVKNVEMTCSSLHAIEEQIQKKGRFTVSGHSLEFYGQCARCA